MPVPSGLSSNLRMRPRYGFTLIELLVVIAIIGILAGILFPAATSAMKSAKATIAKNQAVQIASALTAYETEYGHLPPSSGSPSQIDAAMVGILCSSGDTNNPRGIIFLDATTWKKGKGGTNASGYCDPFSATSVYMVALDTGYSNSISVPTQPTPGAALGPDTNITKRIGVWTVFTNGTQVKMVNSWD